MNRSGRSFALPRIMLWALAVLASGARSEALAAIRVKTVEYNVGGYYGSPLPAGGRHAFPSVAVRLPEEGKAVLSAWLEYEGMALPGTEGGRLRLEFDAGDGAATPMLDAGALVPPSKNSVMVAARADVTAVVAAELEGLRQGRSFSAAVSLEGRGHGMHAARLLITYRFDDASPTQVQTVRFPLYSEWGKRTASSPEVREPGVHHLSYLAAIADSGVTVQRQWFEIRGWRLGLKTGKNGSVACRVGDGPWEPAMEFDNSRRQSHGFLYLTSGARVPGFQPDVMQEVEVSVRKDAVALLGGEVVVTFESSRSSPLKTRTVRYFLGPAGKDPEDGLAAPIQVGETDPRLDAAYLRVSGGPPARDGTVLVRAGFGDASQAGLSYQVKTVGAPLSGWRVLHDLGEGAGPWPGSRAWARTSSTLEVDGGGAELVVTCRYGPGASFTDSFSLFAGQSGGGIKDFAVSLPVLPFGASGLRTMVSSFLSAEFLLEGPAGDLEASISLDGRTARTILQRVAAVPVLLPRVGGFPVNPGGLSGERRVVYAAGGTDAAFGGTAVLTYVAVPAPSAVSYLAQKGRDGIPIGKGQWANQAAVYVSGVLTSPMKRDSLSLEVEFKAADSAFDGKDLHRSGALEYFGTAVSTAILVGPLASGRTFHWRARAAGLGGPGPWTVYGANPDGDMALGCDLDRPPAPSLADAFPADSDIATRLRQQAHWKDVADPGGSGLFGYEVELAPDPAFEALAARLTPSSSEVWFEGLSNQTSYYWRVRARDRAGNRGPYSAGRSFRVELPVAQAHRTPVELVLIGVSILVFLAHLFVVAFDRTRIPDVLPLLAVGALIGPVTGLVTPAAFGEVGSVFAMATLVIILFEGGLSLEFSTLKETMAEGVRLTLATFVATMAVVVLICWPTGIMPFMESALLGAILGGASPAVVIPLATSLPMSPRARTTLVLESSLSDVLCIVFSLALLQSMGHGELRPGSILGGIIASFTFAGLIGAAGAIFWANILERVREFEHSMFMTPTFVILVYGLSEFLGFSGAISSLVFGVVLGNLAALHENFPVLKHLLPARSVHLNDTEKAVLGEVVFIVRTFFFVFIGLSLSVNSLGTAGLAAALCAAVFLARAPIVRMTLSRSTTRADATLTSVLVPKGLATAVLASLPLQAGVASGELIQDLGYAAVIISILACSLLVFLSERGLLDRIGRILFAGFADNGDGTGRPGREEKGP